MKEGNLYLIRNQDPIDVILGVSYYKREFKKIGNHQEPWLIIAQRKDVTKKAEVHYEQVKSQIIYSTSIKEYSTKYQDLSSKIYRINEEMHLYLSWLEVLQVTALCVEQHISNHDDIIKKINELDEFYKLTIKNDEF